MWYSVDSDGQYVFKLLRGCLGASPELEDILGGVLAQKLVNRSHIASILERRGMEAAAEYFRKRMPAKLNTRIGDFGEVVAGRLLEDEDGVISLIEKLQYRDSVDWSMKLTDVFCVEIEDKHITRFVFCEAKAGITRPPRGLGKKAYRQLTKDLVDDEPEILFFTLDRLYERREFGIYSQLEAAMSRPNPVPRAVRIVFVFDEGAWNEDVISDLHEELESKDNDLEMEDDFVSYVLIRENLSAAIDKCFLVAEKAAVDG